MGTLLSVKGTDGWDADDVVVASCNWGEEVDIPLEDDPTVDDEADVDDAENVITAVFVDG
jgi:hypothetical protein